MPKKKAPGEAPPLRDVDNPTAAFPVGTLAGGVARTESPRHSATIDDDDGFFEVEDDESPVDDPDEVETSYIEEEWSAPRNAPTPTARTETSRGASSRPALLALSLVGGIALAFAVVVLIGMMLLLG